MNPEAVTDPRPGRRNQEAFTLTDLLAVLGAVAVLALLALTAMAHSQPASDRAVCANNLRRLMQAWQMYADDYSGLLMANASSTGYLPWVGGFLDYSAANSDNTNALKLTNAAYAAIAPYVDSAILFRCPADLSTVVVGGVPKLRVRSYSMSDVMGPTPSGWNPSYQNIAKMSEVSQPNRIYVLLEEHPDSINDSTLVISMTGGQIIDYPAAFHQGGANLAMADGHVEYWQWADARTMPPVRYNNGLALNVPSPGNPDLERLRAAGSYPK